MTRAAPFLLIFALGCAAASVGSEPTVPACAVATVAVDSAFAEPPRQFVLDAGYSDARFVGAPDSRPEMRNVEDVQRVLIRSYPAALRNAGIGGVATAQLLIDPDGVVIHRRIVSSSGYEGLDAAAVTVLNTMRFSPAVVDGCRASFVAQIPITWRSFANPRR